MSQNNNELAIIIAFYLSKFNKDALKALGYKTDSEAFEKIAEVLGIKKNYIKFRRDEFDPIHPWRKGWQRTPDKRTIKAIEAFQDLSEEELRGIVLQILNDVSYRDSDEIRKIVSLLEYDNENNISGNYVLRGPTGKKAEEYFISYFSSGSFPVTGVLVDTRDLGVGYDFRIDNGEGEFLIEVKGLSEVSGGILFTNKEWQKAKERRDKYYLVIISNIDDFPKVSVICNPFERYSPKRNILKTVQINWSVTAKEIKDSLSVL